MFEKYDPGFLAAFIGLVMSVGLGYSYRWIKILYRFSKLFTKLDELVKSNQNSTRVIELVELVEKARNVPWFKFITRYQIGKSMDELISEIKAHDLKEIVIGLNQPGGANQEIDQAVAEPGAAEERAVEEQTVRTQLDTPEEIIIGESPMIAVAEPGAAEERPVEEQTGGAQLDTPEEIIIGENPMIAGLRRRVGIRPEISENDHARLALTTAEETENSNMYRVLRKEKSIMAKFQWYKERCKKHGGIGYYDTFKKKFDGDTKEVRVDLSRQRLAKIWDMIIQKWEDHKLPRYFESQKTWIKCGNTYRRFIEPLDIARYYAFNSNGNYLSDGRPKRHKVLEVLEELMEESENPKRSRTKCASLTSDSCFWARVEEALKDLENLKRGQQQSLHNLENFEKYVTKMKNARNLSSDVFLEGSSFMRWSEEWEEHKKIQSRG